MSTPDPNNLRLGSAEVFFDRFDAAGARTGLRHIGNVPIFTTTAAIEKIEKKSSMDGARSLLKEVVIGSTLEISLQGDEFEANNLALALMGETETLTQVYAAVTDEDINGGVALNFDVWYKLGSLNVSGVSIEQGGSPLVAGTDYELKADVGWVRILSTGGGAEAATTWSGFKGNVSTPKIKALSVGDIVGSLDLIDAVDLKSGKRYNVTVHKVNLTPDGELNLISDEFGSFTLKGKAQKDITQPDGEEYLIMTEINPSVEDAGS